MPDKVHKQRRPLIEPLEPRLLFSATLDAVLLDEAPLDDLLLQNSASSVDLTQVYDTGKQYYAELTGDEPAIAPLAGSESPARQDLANIIFIDARVENPDTLLAGLSSEAVVIKLEAADDGVAQITAALSQYQNIESVHILSHGNAGAVQLGSSQLNDATIEGYHSELQTWRDALGGDADILLYGCDLAATSAGVAMLSRLGDLTGADVAASDNLTGHSDKGGDWILEYQRGDIESNVVISQTTQQVWQGRLADTHYIHVTAGNTELNVLANNDIGQQFIYDSANSTYNVNEISLMLARYASTVDQTITVHISDSWDGAVLGSGSIASSQISDVGYEWHSFDLGDTPLNDNQSYYIRISTDSGSDDPDSNILVSAHSSNRYNNATLLEAGVENTEGWDLAFKVSEEDGNNAAPIVSNNIANQTRYEDVAYSFTVPSNTFSDADSNDTLRYRAQLAGGGDLDWLVFNPITREFSGTPRADDVGVMSVEVIATDNHGASTSEFFDITINNTNDDPFVRFPLKDQAATQDTPFSFTIPADAFGDEDPGASLTYHAELSGGGALPSWLMFDEASRTFSGTPAASDVGSVTINVTADDGEGGTPAQDNFEIVVTNQTDDSHDVYEATGPTATGTGVAAGMDVYQSFSDIDGSGSYVIDTLAVQLRVNTAAADQTPQTLNIEILEDINGVALAAASRSSAGLTDSFTWESFTLPDVTLNYGQTYYIKLTASGGAADPLVFVGIHDSNVYPNGSYLNHNQVADTTRDLAFQVSHTFNQAPALLNPAEDQLTEQDQPFQYTLPANMFTDPDAGDTLTYTVQREGGGHMGWISYNAATQTLSGTPAAHDVGVTNIEVIATDNHGKSTSDVFTVQVAASNAAPEIANPISDQNTAEHSFFDFTFAADTFSDADGDPLTYTAKLANGDNLPAWLTFDADNRRFYGTSGEGDAGTLVIDVFASDGRGGITDESFNLVIANTNDEPTTENPIVDQYGAEDSFFDFTFAANSFSDIDGDSLSYSARLASGASLPPWLLFDAENRRFYGTPGESDSVTWNIDVFADDGNGGIAQSSFSIIIVNTNDDPHLEHPLPDQTANDNEAFSFTFAENTFGDSDLDSLTYSARLLGGAALPSWLSFDAGSRTFSGTPSTPDIGSLEIQVTADDGNGGTPATDTFTLTVVDTNDDPQLSSSIANQTAPEDAYYSFQFSANTFSDLDGDALTYSAELTGAGALPAWLYFDAASRTFSGTPGGADIGTISVTVFADDGQGGTPASETFTLEVTNTNDDPVVANAIANQNATEDAAFSFQFADNTFHDDDGNALSYSAQLAGGASLPAWLQFDNASRTFSGTPTNADVGSIIVQVMADDGQGGQAAQTSFAIQVANSNDDPVLTSAIADQVAHEDSAFSFQFASTSFTDDDGDALTYSATLVGGGALPAWLSFDAASRTFSGTPANADVGVVSVVVSASDNHGGASAQDVFDIVVNNTNDGPVVANAIADQNATEDTPFSYQFAEDTFFDVDGNTLSYTVAQLGGGALPGWLRYDELTRTFSGTPTNADVGSVSIAVTASDGSASITDSFDINTTNTNDEPLLVNSIADQNATEDSVFSFQLPDNTFSDEDGDTLFYSASLGGAALPAWLNFDAATRTFSGTPLNADVGSLNITVSAFDSSGASASDTFTLTIDNTNDAPELARAIGDQSATEGSAFNFQLPADTFTDVDGDTLLYSAQLVGGGALPVWLSFDASSATFSGTPTNADVGSVSIEVVAADGETSVSATFELRVLNTNDDPVVDKAIADQNAIEDTPFNFQFAADTFADADGDTLSYSARLVGGAALPAWLQFDAGSRTFSGIPGNEHVGNLSIEVLAFDGNSLVSDTFDIRVLNTNDDPVLAQALNDQSAQEDQWFSYQVPAGSFSDADGDTLRYSAQLAGGESLPGWLHFDSTTQTFSGTPGNADVGTVTVTLQASDGYGGIDASASFAIVVANSNDDPQLTNPLADQFATEDSAFSYQLPLDTFTDDDGDSLHYSAFSAGGDPLPAWLSFDAISRTFSGTPGNDDVGVIRIDVYSSDNNGGAVASDSFQLTVINSNDGPTVVEPLQDQTAREDSPFYYQFAADSFYDADGTALSYSAQQVGGAALPDWLHFDVLTRTFSGTPDNNDVATLQLEVTASDGVASGTDSFTLQVLNSNDAPRLNVSLSDQTALEDNAFRYQLVADSFSDDDNDVLRYVAQLAGGDALPAWLSFDATTLTFSGMPAQGDSGVLSVVVSADDGNGGVASGPFTLTVLDQNDGPLLSSPLADQFVSEGSEFLFQLPGNTFFDPDGDELTVFASLAGDQPLPDWLSFDPISQTFSGTPGAGDVGALEVVVRASDAQAHALDHFILTVAGTVRGDLALEPVTVDEDAPAHHVSLADQFYRALNSEALSFSVISNSNQSLFNDISIDTQTGELRLEYARDAFGQSELHIQAQSITGETINAALTVVVLPVNDTPVVTSDAQTTVVTTADTHAYPVSLWGSFFDVEDGKNLSYSISANSNPAVAQVTAVDSDTGVLILSTSANGGTSSLTVRATDSEGAWQEHTLLIDIRAVEPDGASGEDEDESTDLDNTNVVASPERPDPTPVIPELEPEREPIVTQTGGPDTDVLETQTLDREPLIVLPDADDLFRYDTGRDDDRDTAEVVNDHVDRQAQLREQSSQQFELIGLDPSANTHLSLQDIADFSRAVDESRKQVEQAFLEQQKQQEMIAAVSLSLGTGLILWALRASSLLFALFSVLPLWRGVDPLPILENVEKKKKQLAKQKKDRKTEDSSAGEVGYLFDHDVSAKPQDNS